MNEQAAVATISANGWLSACPASFRSWVIANLRWSAYAAGQGVSHAGDEEGGLFCVGHGQLDFVTGVGVADVGASHFVLPGEWLGHAAIARRIRVGSTIARTETLVGVLPRQMLQDRLAAHPENWELMFGAMADVFRVAVGAHADLLIADNSRRVAATLLRLGGWRHRLYRIAPPPSFVCSQEALAGATALSRNTVGKIARSLVSQKLIDTNYGRVVITDPRRLGAIVNDG